MSSLSPSFEKLLQDICYPEAEKTKLLYSLRDLAKEGFTRAEFKLTGRGDNGNGVDSYFYDDREESYEFWQVGANTRPVEDLLYAIAAAYVPGFENADGGGVEVVLLFYGDGISRIKVCTYYNVVRKMVQMELTENEYH